MDAPTTADYAAAAAWRAKEGLDKLEARVKRLEEQIINLHNLIRSLHAILAKPR